MVDAMGIERVDARSAGFDVWTGRPAHDLEAVSGKSLSGNGLSGNGLSGFDVWTGRPAHDLDRFFEDTQDRHMLPASASNAAEEDEAEVEVAAAAEARESRMNRADDLPPPMPISCVVSIDNIFDMRPQPVASRPASTKVRVFPISAEIHTHSSTRCAHTH